MKPHDWIGELLSTYGSKPLILVEGTEDTELYQRMLDLLDPDWRARFALEDVGGKRRVFQGCRRIPTWRGLVDRDEWTATKINEEQQKAPRVQVLPRFTAQNYWIAPDEIEAVIPIAARIASPNAVAQLRVAIESQCTAWTAHGAMWCVMLGRQGGLSHLGFPQELIDNPVTDEVQIMTILSRWHNHLKPQDILAEYQVQRDQALARPAHEQYARVIHGKLFFRRVVTPALNQVFLASNKSAEAWVADLLASTTSVPPDLKPVLEKLLA